MAEKDLEETRRLSPEERIRRLREIAKKSEEEIKKAQALIKESETELEEEEKAKRQIPIPQLKSVDVGSLFGKGTQEELMFKAKRFREPPPRREGEEGVTAPPPLEETVEEERGRLTAAAEEEQRQYQIQLSREPIGELTSRARNIYEAAQERGYVGPEQMEDVSNISYAMKMKQADVRRGEYAPEADKFEEEISAFGGIIKALKDKYKGR